MANEGSGGGKSRRRRMARLTTLSPQQTEEVARWIESAAAKYPALIAQGNLWLKDHPGDTSQIRQNAYWENYLSTCKHLAFLIRREGMRMMHQAD